MTLQIDTWEMIVTRTHVHIGCERFEISEAHARMKEWAENYNRLDRLYKYQMAFEFAIETLVSGKRPAAP